MFGRELVGFTCWFGCRGHCTGCQLTAKWNTWRKFCHCGAPATGYRAMGRDVEVEFLCNEHVQDVPPVGSDGLRVTREDVSDA